MDTKENPLDLMEEHSSLQALKEIQEIKKEDSKEKYRRLTPRQWREIEILWESGEVTLKNLSERYGKHIDTFADHFKKYGVKKGARAEELRRIAEEISREQAKTDAGIIAGRIRATREEHYKMATAIGKITFGLVLETRKNGKEYKTIQNDIKSLYLAMNTLQKVREERWTVLGLDKDVTDEETLPELVMSTMTPEQAQALRQAQEEDDEEMGIDDDKMVFQTDKE